MMQIQDSNLPVPISPAKCNKTSPQLAIGRAGAEAADYVVHLSLDHVRRLAAATRTQIKRNVFANRLGERNRSNEARR